jgi:hypothetical protein
MSNIFMPTSNNQHVTAKQLAEKLNVPYLESYNLLQLLVSMGMATVVGKKRQPGRGKPSEIYTIPREINFSVDCGDNEETADDGDNIGGVPIVTPVIVTPKTVKLAQPTQPTGPVITFSM